MACEPSRAVASQLIHSQVMDAITIQYAVGIDEKDEDVIIDPEIRLSAFHDR